jgi:hypothetical protein
MASPIERIFALKTEAQKQGLIGSHVEPGRVKILAGGRFVDDLLMDASLRWNAKISRDSMTVFGIPIVPADYPAISRAGLKLVVELDG